MEIMTIECPKCHGSLHVEHGTEKMFCMYCRAEVVVRDTRKNDFSTSDSLIKRGFLLVEHRDWEKALEVFDRAADIDPENAQIYLGMLLAETRRTEEGSLKTLLKPLSGYTSYQKAVKFAESELKKRLEAYNAAGVKRLELKRMLKRVAEAKREQDIAQKIESEEIKRKQLEKQIEKELENWMWSYWIISVLSSFVCSIIVMEIFFSTVNKKFGLVNLDLFRNWDWYSCPIGIVVTFFVCWLFLLFYIARDVKKNIRALVEKELAVQE